MFAEVIVDISNSEVDRIFDYSVGDSGAQKGSRVKVPFGNRTIEGYVIDLKETSELNPAKIKDIAETLDDMPVIGEEMLSLMRFMTEKYNLRLVDVLRLFIPSQMRGGRVKELTKQYARLNPDFENVPVEEFIRPSAKSQAEIYEHLKTVGKDSTAEINKNFSAAALRNLTMRGIVLIESAEVKRTPYKFLSGNDKKVVLTEAQRAVADAICEKSDTYLLHGVTGSGKTEVYMECISRMLEKGKTAIMLVPEISLTPQVLKNFRLRFGENVALLHSALSAGERFDEWRRLLKGEAKVCVGARSAIFAPLKNVGVIIVDEEHDNSYVSESNPRYSALRVAAFRREYNGCSLVLGSATPSIESYYNAKIGEYKLLELPERINKRALPQISVVNMCSEIYDGNNSLFSRRLESELHECMDGGNQAIIFINRRGYSSFMMCRSCGYVAKCTDCDVSLVYHREENVLKCHYCGNRYAALDICPQCKSPHIKQGYVGTERVKEQLEKMFPDKTVLRMDNDTTRGKDAHTEILSKFAKKEADILVGTQMIAKGHDFPDVTLVGIVDADMSLHFSDYRSAERTFQLITQVSGRAGRDKKTGKVVLQTYTPNHYVYKYAVNNDYKSFFDKECNLREVTKYPPFSTVVRVLVSSQSESDAMDALKNIFDRVKPLAESDKSAFAYLGAMRSPLKRIQNKFRVQILARITENADKYISEIYGIVNDAENSKVSCFVEINPANLS